MEKGKANGNSTTIMANWWYEDKYVNGDTGRRMESFHDNGQLSSEGKYVNGKRKANGNSTTIMAN